MIRARLGKEAPPASAMSCEVAGNCVAALVAAPMSLTEWALLESHLRRCSRCRELEARLRRLVTASPPVAPSRRLQAHLRKTGELVRIGAAGSHALAERCRALPAALGSGLAARATAGVMRTRSLAGRCAGDLMARGHAGMAIARRPAVAAVDGVEAVRSAVVRCVQRAVHSAPSLRRVGAMLALAITVCALPGTDGPEPRALPPAAPPAGIGPGRLEAAQVESAQPEPVPVEPVLAEPVLQVSSVPRVPSEPPRAGQGRDTLLAAPPRVVAPSSPVVSAPKPSLEARAAAPTLSAEEPPTASHVIGRLTAKNRHAADRDVGALLAGVGGTELGRRHLVTFTSVDVIVPQSRYDEFATGLARIGSWRLEAARSTLPEAVQITIRVTD